MKRGVRSAAIRCGSYCWEDCSVALCLLWLKGKQTALPMGQVLYLGVPTSHTALRAPIHTFSFLWPLDTWNFWITKPAILVPHSRTLTWISFETMRIAVYGAWGDPVTTRSEWPYHQMVRVSQGNSEPHSLHTSQGQCRVLGTWSRANLESPPVSWAPSCRLLSMLLQGPSYTQQLWLCFPGKVEAELGKTSTIEFLYSDNILVPRHKAVCWDLCVQSKVGFQRISTKASNFSWLFPGFPGCGHGNICPQVG